MEREVTGTSSARRVTGSPPGKAKGRGAFRPPAPPPEQTHSPFLRMPYYDFRAGSAFPLWNVFQRGISSKTVPFLGKYIHEKHLITYTCGKSTSHKFLASDARSLQPGKNIKRTFRKLSRKVSCKTKESPVTELETSAGSRPWDRGVGKAGHQEGVPVSKRTFFRPFGLKFGVEIKGGRGPRALPWLRHWKQIQLLFLDAFFPFSTLVKSLFKHGLRFQSSHCSDPREKNFFSQLWPSACG